MKVIQVTSMHDWKDDRIYERACIGLAKRGIEVHLIASPELSFYKNNEKNMVKLNDRESTVHGVHIHWLKQRSGIKRMILSSKEAAEIALRIDADIIHFHDPQLLPWMLRLKKKCKARIFYDIHENHTQSFHRRKILSGLANSFRRYERNAIAKLDGFTAISESLSDFFKPYNSNYFIIPNIPDIASLADVNINQEKEKRPVIFSSGSHTRERNCMPLVKAMKYVVAKHPESILRFAGKVEPPSYKEALIETATQDGTINHLDMAGMVPWKENFDRTIRAHMGMVTYENTENYRIAIPNRIFEYMFCSLPVIATDFPELRKIINETKCGLLVDTENPNAIADAINYIIEHPEEARTMGANGRVAVLAKYNYDNVLTKMIDFYRKSLN